MDPIRKDTHGEWNAIVVLESLPEKERTGKELYDSIIKRRMEQSLDSLRGGYRYIFDKQQLVTYLSQLRESIKYENIKPIIHIEAHGSIEGLHLESGEIISWEDLISIMRPLNVLSKNNLFLVLASCHGVNIGEYISVFSRVPFRGAIAPAEEVSKREIEEGFLAFYEVFFSNTLISIHDAITALNQGEDNRFMYIHAWYVFDFLWRKFLAMYKVKSKRDKMIRDIVHNSGLDINTVRTHYEWAFKGGEEVKKSLFAHYIMDDLS
jgi:hypothetical protein